MFRVGLTVDFLRPDGRQAFPDIDLGPLDRAEGVEWHCLETGADEVPPEAAADCDALLVLGPRISAATLEDAGRLARGGPHRRRLRLGRRGRLHAGGGRP